LQRALCMGRHERAQRMRNLRRTVSENNVYAWAANVIRSLVEVEQPSASGYAEQPLSVASGVWS
jgi:trehalose-6-phosphate synthase